MMNDDCDRSSHFFLVDSSFVLDENGEEESDDKNECTRSYSLFPLQDYLLCLGTNVSIRTRTLLKALDVAFRRAHLC